MLCFFLLFFFGGGLILKPNWLCTDHLANNSQHVRTVKAAASDEWTYSTVNRAADCLAGWLTDWLTDWQRAEKKTYSMPCFLSLSVFHPPSRRAHQSSFSLILGSKVCLTTVTACRALRITDAGYTPQINSHKIDNYNRPAQCTREFSFFFFFY